MHDWKSPIVSAFCFTELTEAPSLVAASAFVTSLHGVTGAAAAGAAATRARTAKRGASLRTDANDNLK